MGVPGTGWATSSTSLARRCAAATPPQPAANPRDPRARLAGLGARAAGGGRPSTGGVRGAGGFIVAVHGRWWGVFGRPGWRWRAFRQTCPPGREFSCSNSRRIGAADASSWRSTDVLNFDLGAEHYAARTPLGGGRGKTLGMDRAWRAAGGRRPAYAARAAICAPSVGARWWSRASRLHRGALVLSEAQPCRRLSAVGGRLAVVGALQASPGGALGTSGPCDPARDATGAG